jgi:hypothetical protein
VQEKGRLSRVAGCDSDEAWFELKTVFIMCVAITCYALFLNVSGRCRLSRSATPQEFLSLPGMLAAPCSGSGAPQTYALSYAQSYTHRTQDIVRNWISGTKYSVVSRQVKSFYLLSKA